MEPRPNDETRRGYYEKRRATRYRGRIEKIERPRDRLLAVLADHITDGSRHWNREGGEPLSQGPTVGEVKQGITFLWKELWKTH